MFAVFFEVHTWRNSQAALRSALSTSTVEATCEAEINGAIGPLFTAPLGTVVSKARRKYGACLVELKEVEPGIYEGILADTEWKRQEDALLAMEADPRFNKGAAW
jgi:hypothetical protein